LLVVHVQSGTTPQTTSNEQPATIPDRLFAFRRAIATRDEPTAREIARELDERHTYDSVYLAVARAFGMQFWTANQKLLRRLDDRFQEARFGNGTNLRQCRENNI